LHGIHKKSHLADVYTALGERLVAPELKDDTASCSIEHALHKRVADIMETIEQSLIERLSTTTIAQVQGLENAEVRSSPNDR